MYRLPSIFVIVLSIFSSDGGFAGQAPSVADFRGHTIALEQPAERVVCLIESALSGIYMLGAESSVIGVSTNIYDEDVFDYYAAIDTRIAEKQLPTPGNWDFVNIESVLALSPDLVIIWANQVEAIQALEEHGLAVYTVQLTSLEDVFKEIKDLGQLLGRQQRAESLSSFAETELRKLQETSIKTPESARPSIYFMWAQGLLETSGGSSTANDLITLAGGKNVARNLDQEHLVVNLENIVGWQPDIIVMWINSRLSPEDVKKTPVWSTLPAARQNRIYELPEVFLCDFWTLKFLYAAKLINSWCKQAATAAPPDQINHYQQELLTALYGPEKGEKLVRAKNK